MEKIRKFVIFLVIFSLVSYANLNQYNWARPRNTNSRVTTETNPAGTTTTTYTYSTGPTYSTTSSSSDGSSSPTFTSSSTRRRNRRPATSSTASSWIDNATTNAPGTRTGGYLANNSGGSTRTRTNNRNAAPVIPVTESNTDSTANTSTSPSESPPSNDSSTSSSTNTASDSASPSSTSTTSTNSTSSTITFIDISQNNQYGSYLVNGDGYSLYVNVADGPGQVTCYDDCIKRFIPTSIKLGSNLSINQRLDDNLVASIGRADGINQLTFNKYPLYLYAGDKDPGQTNAQGMNNTWYLINDKGKPINNRTDDDTSASSSTDNASLPALGPAAIGLTLSASTSMLVVPDTFLLYFTIISKNADFAIGLTDVEKKSRDLIGVMRKLNSSNNSAMSKVSLVDKKTFYNNQNCYFSYTFLTTTTDTDLVDKIGIVVNRLNQRDYNISFSPDYTLSEKLLKSVKTFLYGMAVKTAMENALEMTEKLRFEINKKRPIISIKVDSSAMQSYYPLFFKDTSSFYFLNKKKGVNVITLKSTIDFNIKKK